MDMKTIKAAIELGQQAASDIMTLTAQGDLADESTLGLMRATANTIRRQMAPDLSPMLPSPEGAELVIDSSKSTIAQADYAEARWYEYADACYRYLDAYERLKPSAEALNNLKQANEFVALLEGAGKALVAANARANREAHPQPTTGLLDIRLAPPDWAVKLQSGIDEILVWVREHTGTGEPPVVVTEGVVGEFVEYKPWHSTAGTGGIMYGNPGQPKLLLGNWQYDALYRCAQTGTFLTVAVPGGTAKHITVLPDATFWVSVATGEIPRAPIPVVLSAVEFVGC